MVKDIKIRLHDGNTSFREIGGLALLVSYGCLGKKYKEDGFDMFIDIRCTILVWTKALHISWKKF